MKLPPQAGGPPASNPDVFDASCSARHALELISTKWAILIMSALATGSMRNGALLRKVDGISQKMLTQTLKDLERNGLVQRHDQQTIPPHVEYSLSAIGLSLSETLISLDRWAERNFPELDRFRAQFDAATGAAKAAKRLKIRAP